MPKIIEVHRPKPTLFDEEERRKVLTKAAEIREEFRKKK